jgi:hypothetical protein
VRSRGPVAGRRGGGEACHPLAVGDEGPIRIFRIHGLKAGGQHRVGAGESIHFVGIDHRFGVPPAEAELGVMALALADGADPVDLVERRTEIGETPGLAQVVVIHNLPARQLLQQLGDFLLREGGCPLPAGKAGLIVKSHGITSWFQDFGMENRH